jgi:hypothetical protein
MHGEREQCRRRRNEYGAALRPLERAHEKVSGQRARKREERVHPPERPIHQ